MLRINRQNIQVGQKAKTALLRLYSTLIEEQGFDHAQADFIDPDDFDGFSFLDVEVTEGVDIDQRLLRQGAIIFLLCHLHDMIEEFDDDFLNQEFSQRIISQFRDGKMVAIPEVAEVMALIDTEDGTFDYKVYRGLLDKIYRYYVYNRCEAASWSRTTL